jgi:hypothetical protein
LFLHFPFAQRKEHASCVWRAALVERYNERLLVFVFLLWLNICADILFSFLFGHVVSCWVLCWCADFFLVLLVVDAVWRSELDLLLLLWVTNEWKKINVLLFI